VVGKWSMMVVDHDVMDVTVTHGYLHMVSIPISTGTGACGYGYRWTQKYPWVTRDEPYGYINPSGLTSPVPVVAGAGFCG